MAKLLLNAKNVINGHSPYVLYAYVHVISVLSKSPFYHIYVTLSQKITHSTKADMLTHMFYLDTPLSLNQLTTLGFYIKIQMLIMVHIIAKKRPMNLVLISHKYSQRNTNLRIIFCYRCENLFSLQSEG